MKLKCFSYIQLLLLALLTFYGHCDNSLKRSKYIYEDSKIYHHFKNDNGVRLGCFGHYQEGKMYSTFYVADSRGYRIIPYERDVVVYPQLDVVRRARFGRNLEEGDFSFPIKCSEMVPEEPEQVEWVMPTRRPTTTLPRTRSTRKVPIISSTPPLVEQVPFENFNQESINDLNSSSELKTLESETKDLDSAETSLVTSKIACKDELTTHPSLPEDLLLKETTESTQSTFQPIQPLELEKVTEESPIDTSTIGSKKFKITFLINKDDSGLPTKLKTVKIGSKVFPSEDDKDQDPVALRKHALSRLWKLLVTSMTSPKPDGDEEISVLPEEKVEDIVQTENYLDESVTETASQEQRDTQMDAVASYIMKGIIEQEMNADEEILNSGTKISNELDESFNPEEVTTRIQQEVDENSIDAARNELVDSEPTITEKSVEILEQEITTVENIEPIQTETDKTETSSEPCDIKFMEIQPIPLQMEPIEEQNESEILILNNTKDEGNLDTIEPEINEESNEIKESQEIQDKEDLNEKINLESVTANVNEEVLEQTTEQMANVGEDSQEVGQTESSLEEQKSDQGQSIDNEIEDKTNNDEEINFEQTKSENVGEVSTTEPETETEISVVTSISMVVPQEVSTASTSQIEDTTVADLSAISGQFLEKIHMKFADDDAPANGPNCSHLIVPIPLEKFSDTDRADAMKLFGKQLIQKVLEVFNRH